MSIRFLTGLLATCVALSAGCFFVYRLRFDQLADRLSLEAQSAEADGQKGKATSRYRRLLRLKPNDSAAQLRYAELLDEQVESAAQLIQAIGVLNDVLSAQPNQNLIRKRLARRAIQIGQYTAAQQHLAFLLKKQKNDAQLERLLAQCAVGNQEYHTAASWLDLAIQHAQQPMEVYLQLAALYSKLDDSEHLFEVLDAMVSANANAPKAYAARARYHSQRHAFKRADADLSKARALAPDDIEILALSAEVAFAQGKTDHARELLKKCVPEEGTRVALQLLHAKLEQRAGRNDAALSILEKGLNEAPKEQQNDLRVPLLDLLMKEGRLEEAEAHLRSLRRNRANGPDRLALDFLEARLRVQRGQWPEAATLVERLTNLNAPVERTIASSMQRVVEEPTDHRYHLTLGLQLWNSYGACAEAEASLQAAVDVGREAPDALAMYVHYLMHTKNREKAEATLDQVSARSPQMALALAYCHEITGHPERAEPILDSATATGRADVLRAAADLHLRRNQFKKAEPHLRRLTDSESKAAVADQVWARRNLAIGLVSFRCSNEDVQEALDLLAKNRELARDNAEDQRAWALVIAREPTRRAEAIGLLEDMAARKTLWAQDRFLLVRLYETDRDWPKAQAHLSVLLADASAKTPALLAYAAHIELQHGKLERAQSCLAELQKAEPDSFRTAALQARVAKASGDALRARAILEHFANRLGADLGSIATVMEEIGHAAAADKLIIQYIAASKQPQALLMRARFLGRQGRLPEALRLCETSSAACTASDLAGVYIALLHTKEARPADRERVEKWLQKESARAPKTPATLLALAEVYDLQARYPDAIETYRQVLGIDKDNLLALNNLAWLLAKTGDRPYEALELINAAMRHAGPSPQLLDTRAVIYIHLGEDRAAVSDLRRATATEASGARYFHLAQAYLLSGRRNEAVRAFDLAKGANLTVDDLHPSEKAGYEQLTGALCAKSQ